MENINFTAFDFETAYGQKNACQLGIVVVRKGKIVVEKEYLIQPPDNKISTSCQRIHGIKPKMTEDAPLFPEVWKDAVQYFEKQVVVHHSDGFDIRILEQEFEYYDIESCRFLAKVSTMNLFDQVESRSLKNICNAYNIDMNNHHNSLSDARCCAELFIKYLNGDTLDKDKIIKPSRKTSYNEFVSDSDRVLDSDVKKQDLSIVKNASTMFYDKKVVISGVFTKFPLRNDLALLLKNYGADINGSISSKTNIFIWGNDFGSKKMQKVLELNQGLCDIQVISEEELYNILDTIDNG